MLVDYDLMNKIVQYSYILLKTNEIIVKNVLSHLSNNHYILNHTIFYCYLFEII